MILFWTVGSKELQMRLSTVVSHYLKLINQWSLRGTREVLIPDKAEIHSVILYEIYWYSTQYDAISWIAIVQCSSVTYTVTLYCVKFACVSKQRFQGKASESLSIIQNPTHSSQQAWASLRFFHKYVTLRFGLEIGIHEPHWNWNTYWKTLTLEQKCLACFQ
jgi:hypothetical protein